MGIPPQADKQASVNVSRYARRACAFYVCHADTSSPTFSVASPLHLTTLTYILAFTSEYSYLYDA